MGMTIWRWSVGVALGCGAFAAILLPFPATPSLSWAPSAPAPLAEEIARLSQAAGQAHAAVRTYRAAQALDRWSAATSHADTTLVRIDRSVPVSIAASVRQVAVEQMTALGTPVSAAHAEVFVYFDSTSIARSGDTVISRRVLELGRYVDVMFALPQATDGQRCVALVRLRGSSPAHLNVLRSQSLIGVCGFFAAHGMPGDRVQEWLAATRYRFATRSDWSVARAPATDASSLYSLSEAGTGCLTGAIGACVDALGVRRVGGLGSVPGGRLLWVVDPAMTANAALDRSARARLGSAEDAFLADAARSLGPERFQRFWRASSAPDSAFLAAAGIGLDAWTQQWLSRTYGSAPVPPTARIRDLVWLVLLAPAALFIAARPRHRVLADRLFASRA